MEGGKPYANLQIGGPWADSRLREFHRRQANIEGLATLSRRVLRPVTMSLLRFGNDNRGNTVPRHLQGKSCPQVVDRSLRDLLACIDS
jgi:hypothetical protein